MKNLMTMCAVLGMLISCGPFPTGRQNYEEDLAPPLFLGLERSGEELILTFDEEIRLTEGTLGVSPELPLGRLEVEETAFTLLPENQVVGQEYTLVFDIEDPRGNSANMKVLFYGYNPSLPRVVINEFITRGSAAHPDIVELFVVEGGNMGGVTLFQGTYGNWEDRFIFPSFDVSPGEFILVHFKPQGLDEEVDETGDKTFSRGLDASANAFDFWLPGGTGLGGNNGVLSLYTSPSGEKILDGVLYSNRTRDSDEDYGGFGSRTNLERGLELVAAGGWLPEEETLYPEDGLNPEHSSSTRSWCRDSASRDTNSAEDWHIVPTRGASFGEINRDEVYDPGT